MATATDAGVRSGRNSTEMWMFLISVGAVLANGTAFVNVPWDTMSGIMAMGGLGMALRGGQKTVATYVSGKSPPEKNGDRNVP